MNKLKSFKSIQHPYNSHIFTEEILEYLKDEGFEFRDSYHSYAREECLAEASNTEISQSCYVLRVNKSSDFLITVFIRNVQVEIDIDYDCGGNYRCLCYRFNSNDSLVFAINSAIDFVKSFNT